MIDPRCPIKSITVEASKQPESAGECVIDVAEYSEVEGDKAVTYFQLKHSSLPTKKVLNLSDAKKTLAGFAARFRTTIGQKGPRKEIATFTLVTNRPISSQLETEIQRIRLGSRATPAFKVVLEQATKLKGNQLRAFCQALTFVGAEGDYISQKEQLHGEMTEYIAGFIDSPEVDHLIALVSERALPNLVAQRRRGEILAEDVLKRIAGGAVLFPAPPDFEKLPNVVPREQQASLLDKILENNGPTIIHAAGGVGKSVMARQMTRLLPHNSLAIVYDCFGGGMYRNESSPRHRPCDALVQIANELATLGRCGPLIGHSKTPRDVLFREFMDRLTQATKAQQEINKKSELLIVIDAGDNAEMAATERGDHSFVKALLREPFPKGCRLVVLCRTERIGLLDPPSRARQFALRPFSRTETATHLRETFPAASANEAEEFHRLTGGNPRVQANALGISQRKLSDILLHLGPVGTSVADQISAQLDSAIANLRDKSPNQAKAQIDAICLGLANLPPFIPLAVLAAAAKVDISTIQSFVSDLGRPLWSSESSVHFRDEPTETWFREKFSANAAQIKSFVKFLEPLAADYTYVAKALPRLLLLAGDLKRLVTLSLSDDLLPKGNPIDERDVRVYRLQFAFRAALKLGRLADAVRLAFRAGEEMAGNQRQIELLGHNTDLIAPLQDAQKVEELAYTAKLRGGWTGSENIYAASLLSAVPDFRGEAQGRLRAAMRWLRVYFDERASKKSEANLHEDRLGRSDILELVWTIYNLHGAKAATEYLLTWTPPDVAFDVGGSLVRRLVDAGNISAIEQVAQAGVDSAHLLVALTEETSLIAYSPTRAVLDKALNKLLRPRTRIARPEGYSHRDSITPAILSFAEACAGRRLPRRKILSLLRYYTPRFADSRVADDFHETERTLFVRAAALKAVLANTLEPDLKVLCFAKLKKGTKIDYEAERRHKEMLEVVGALMPWYILRARFISNDRKVASVDLESVRGRAKASLFGRYRSNDSLNYEMSLAWFRVLVLKNNVTQAELDHFNAKTIQKADRKFKLTDRLDALRSAIRLSHLSPLGDLLEESCRTTIELPGGTPEENAGDYIRLARAVLPQSREDAAVYFGSAVNAVSKFGDEMVHRWEAVVSIARRASLCKADRRKLTYRFLQCAEMIGESVVREKYWNRDDVFSVAVRLDAPSAFAGLSRWRDRDVGDFPWQLRALATEAIDSKIISPSVAWCLSGFIGCNNSVDFAITCIRNETVDANRERLLTKAIANLKLNGSSPDSWQKLLSLAAELCLDQTALKEIIAEHDAAKPPVVNELRSASSPIDHKIEKATAEYRSRIQRVNVLDTAELNRLVDEQAESEPPRDTHMFWNEVIRVVGRGREKQFLKVFLTAKNLGYIDIGYAVAAIHSLWGARIAVKQAWPDFIFEVGRRFATEFSDRYRLGYRLQMHPMSDEYAHFFSQGIQAGLAEMLDLTDATTFFGFINSVADKLKPEDAQGLLDYSLERFERHMDPEHGDGQWSNWQNPSKKLPDAFTGLIWSALGSPYASMRWQAVHSVRLLAANGFQAEIAALVSWMQSGKVGAFGGKNLPFYELHARLYLLIALERVALDDSKSLKRFAQVFGSIATTGFPHALIQTTAAKIASLIEQAYPNTFSPALKSKLRRVGTTSLSIIDLPNRAGFVPTPWHAEGKVDTHLSLSFGIDFEPYWFKYLANAFGASGDQVTELIREVALKELKIPRGDGYTPDPRQKQWRNHGRYTKETTSHDHGNYPYVDDYRFYYAYHSMMSVAMRLLKHMPLARGPYWDNAKNPWNDWFDDHLLTRTDGKWLADRRDPTPIKRRTWTNQRREQNWPWQLKADDFFDVLGRQGPDDYPICVGGWWSDHIDDYVENICVRSAFVDAQSAPDLAALLRSINPGDYGLPDYEERDFAVNDVPFDATGWLLFEQADHRGLDKFDPHARDIFYPGVLIGSSFAEASNLTSDNERRVWTDQGGKGCLISETWSDEDISEKDRQYRYGKRMSATVEFLKELCALRKQTLIFDVRIERERKQPYNFETDLGYIPWSHKIFIFSSDGVMRDSKRTFRL